MVTETSELRRGIGQLRQSVRTLMMKYGDAPSVRRLVNDLERMSIDIDDFEQSRPAPVTQPAPQAERIVVPDTPYDDSLWDGVDDEGVGGYHGDRS
ncbi:hypothetical protein ONR57_11095 [Hoyosella sp. YIM 151337]|uniref:hypothetical protein n=1 Tax=Hoyosella sp. YIM 151337 TaxID=2992742 RepID=UPI0022368F7A|nr:hypothetical protein [Hoyosella sp. YIM 151337]MCW4353844.1 hypothetical protein [Hoyosella sp. YIM 151337]